MHVPSQRWSNFPPVVTAVMALCIGMFLIQSMNPRPVIEALALWPLGEYFAPWQLVTYGFLHGSFFHIFINLFVLWMFGVRIENLWGSGRFALYFFVCVIGAGLVQLVVATLAAAEGTIYPTVGASGGVFGVLLAFGVMFPNERIMLLIPPIPLKAKWFVVIIGAISLLAGLAGDIGNIAHFAHLGGMVFGLLVLLWWGWRPGRYWVG